MYGPSDMIRINKAAHKKHGRISDHAFTCMTAFWPNISQKFNFIQIMYQIINLHICIVFFVLGIIPAAADLRIVSPLHIHWSGNLPR